MKTELLDITLIDLKDRVRHPTDDLDKLCDSIKRYGLLQPVLVDQNKVLLDGWRRYTACKKLNWTTIPVYYRESLNAAEYYEVELETNLQRLDFSWQETVQAVVRIHKARTTSAAKEGKAWTQEMTGELLGGYSPSYVSNCLALVDKLGDEKYAQCKHITDAVRVAEREREDRAMLEQAKRMNLRPAAVAIGKVVEQKPAIVTPDTIHEVDISNTVLNGDCRDVCKDWPDACVNHIITDPPFAIDVEMLQQCTTALIDAERVKDTHTVDENLKLFDDMLPLFFRLLKDDGFCLLWCDIMRWQLLYDLASKVGFKVQRWPHVWCKTSQCKNQMAYDNETKATEFVIILRKARAKIHTPIQKNYTIESGDCEKSSNPFAKPYAVWHPLITSFSIPGQLILEPFAGEGSCVTSCLQLQRRVVAIEKDVVHFPYLLANVKEHYNKAFQGKVKFV